MVFINFFYYIHEKDAVTPKKKSASSRELQGSLVSGEWFPATDLERNGTSTTKDSIASPQVFDRAIPIRNHQARIDFDMNGSPECIFIKDSDCDKDDWSVSTIGRSTTRRFSFKPVTTPIVKGTF